MKTIRLYTNDPKQASVLFTLQGTVQPDIELSAARLHFGDIRRGETPEMQFTVSASKDLGIRIENANTRSQSLEVVSEDFVQGEQVGKRVKVKLKPGIGVGTFRDRIVIRTSSGNNPVINVPVFARVQGDVYFSPSVASFGLIDAKSEKAISQVVRIEVVKGAKVNLVSLESDNPAVKAELASLEDGKGKGIKVTVNQDLSGAFRARIKVTTDHADPEQRQLVLPVYGIISSSR